MPRGCGAPESICHAVALPREGAQDGAEACRSRLRPGKLLPSANWSMTMNWEAIGAIGEMGGAIGVIVTLIYLAGQLRQNTKALKSASYEHWNEISSFFTDFYARYAAELSEIEACAGLADLTPRQQKIVSAYGIKAIDQAQTAFLHHRAGTLDDDVFEARMNAFDLIFERFPLLGEAWWEYLRQYPASVFVEFVERRISGPMAGRRPAV
jgi:hypothetical protein